MLVTDVGVSFDEFKTSSADVLGFVPVSNVLQLTDLPHRAAGP